MTGLAILVGHLVGDYLWQNDWMANRKVYKKDDPLTHSRLPCLVHVFLYTLATALAVEVTNALLGNEAWPWWAWAIIAGTHYPMDRYRLAARYMDFAGQRKFRENLGPWSLFIVDNSIHIVTSWAVALAALAS